MAGSLLLRHIFPATVVRTRSVYFGVAPKLLKPPEARRVEEAMRRYFGFKRAWPAGPEGYCFAVCTACNIMDLREPPVCHSRMLVSGIQYRKGKNLTEWIPACAGMTHLVSS